MADKQDRRLWADVLSCGGYHVLVTPLNAREVYTLIPMAWRRWNRANRMRRTDEGRLVAMARES
jgi:hypothetical protein